jgi:hypothetical protein
MSSVSDCAPNGLPLRNTNGASASKK